MADILSRKSDNSRASQQSQKILDEVSYKSGTKIYSLQGLLTDETVNSVWGSFGLYISKQLRSGRSVKIPHFGVFTFTNPDVTLPGVTNPDIRDKQLREPVFIVQKDFLNGIPIQSGIQTDQGVRPINLQGLCGNIQMIQINQLEISESANCSKENVRLSLERVFRQISIAAKKDGFVQMIIPAIGTFQYKKGLVNVSFYESLKRECKGIVKRPLDEQIQKRQRYLTADKLKQLDQESQQFNSIQSQTIDGSAIDWLGKNYDFKLNESVKQQKSLNEKSRIPSQKSCSISFTNESQILLNGQQPLKKMQHWMLQSNLTPLQIFDTIAIKKAKHPNFISRDEQGEVIKLNKDEFISFLQKIGCPIPVAELEFIFMKLDKQNNGYVDYTIFKQEITGRDDSIVSIQRSLKDLWIKLKLNFQKKNLKDLLIDPTKKLQKEDVQSFLLSMEPAIKKQDFPKIISLLLNGQPFIESSKLATILSNTFDDLHSDLNWVQQTKRKIQQYLQLRKEGVPYLMQEFIQQDPKKSGEVDASNFKLVLKKCKIDLNQTDVNRLFKYESSNGVLNYNDFIKSIEISTTFFPPFNSKDSQNLQKLARSINSYIEQNSLNHFSFVKNLYQKENINNEDTSKIKVSLFARLIFKYVNPDIKPHIIDYLSEIIDIDKDGFIDKFDLETFIQRYKNFSLNQQQKPQTIQIGGLEVDQNLLEGIETENLPESLKIKKKEDNNFGVHYDDYDEDEFLGNNSSQFNGNPQRKIKLTEKQIDNLNGIIRKALHDKKISNYDAFNILDSNQDGFIILSEMSNLDKIIKLNQSQKEGYFCYMDNLNTGMIDYQRFLEVINKPINFKQEIKEDNWDWQFEMLEKMRKWYKTQNLDYMEAFKIADIDFDGQIGKKDLHSFLSDILHIPQDIITETRLDRLYKLIDQHKRDSIQFGDFKKVIEDAFDINAFKDRSQFKNGNNLIQSASESKLSKIRYPSTSNTPYRKQVFDEINSQSAKSAKLENNQKLKSSYSSSVFQSSKLNQTINELNQAFSSSKQGSIQSIFEWKINAKHQIGLFVSKFYPDIRTSFEIVSGHQNRLLYTKFKQWIDENRVLKGFNLTEKLLQQLFSDFDPHKKGYLSEHDWVSQLKSYDSTEMMIKEISEGIETQFSDAKEAFQTFSESGKDINFKQFCLQVFAQQPKRFKEEDLIKAWNRVAGSIGHTINFNDFKEVFFRKPNSLQKAQKEGNTFVSPYASSQNKNKFNSTLSLISYDNAQNSTLSVIERMKKLVKSSDKVLENLFEEHDKSNSGFVTNLEFRNVMKKLNIGLSIFDIDSVLNICESKSGALINWREFCNKIKQTDSDLRLVSRARARLEKIRKHIYQYLLSPKDAFRQYNENRSGKMTFDEFKGLIIQLGQLSQSELPSLPIIKDIFEFIDIRRDGVIDIHEWMETFRKIEVDQSPLQTLKKNNSKQLSKSLKIPKVIDLSKGNQIFSNSNNGQFDVQLFSWECSQQFDLVLAVIGKNRKLLLDKFKNEHKLGCITYEKAKSIIGQVLEQSNIRLSDKNFSCLIKFAEKNGELDYRFLMEVFKQRQEQLQYYPIK
ncbi:hypothetical protein ABPG74_010370 [Tetrahymena malaccensis]